MAQSRRDLKAAKDSLNAENFEWCAFQAQQAAEKALKALLLFHHRQVRGHSLVHLLGSVPDHVPVTDNLLQVARELDRHYIQPRYPNGFSEGYPGEYYDAKIAGAALRQARRLYSFARTYCRKLS
jgi:HEPN domain-containing protein